MKDLLKLILGILASLFKSRAKLEAEILVLRQQINVLRRRAPKRPHLNNTDRFLFVWLYRRFPSVLGAIAIVRPETIIRWYLDRASKEQIVRMLTESAKNGQICHANLCATKYLPPLFETHGKYLPPEMRNSLAETLRKYAPKKK